MIVLYLYREKVVIMVKKSGNQLQFKIIISKLQDKVTYKEYKL